MALELVGGSVLGKVVGELLKAVLDARQKASTFHPALTRLESTLKAIIPRLDQISRLNYKLDLQQPVMEELLAHIINGKALILKCSKISTINFVRKVQYSKEILDLENTLLRYFMTILPLDHFKDTKEILVAVKRLEMKLVGDEDRENCSHIESGKPKEGPMRGVLKAIKFHKDSAKALQMKLEGIEDARIGNQSKISKPTNPSGSPLKEAIKFNQDSENLAPPAVTTATRDRDAIFRNGGTKFLTGKQYRMFLVMNSRRGMFNYGYSSSFQGERSTMQDFYAWISKVDGQRVAIFGVFDGHGGSRTAEYLKNNLFKNLKSHPDFIEDTRSAIVEVFIKTDADYINEAKFEENGSGSTASIAVLLKEKLIVANVGDSGVVACIAGEAVSLTREHYPHRPDESQRIQKAGGVVMWSGKWRVCGILDVSRAFGDILLKKYVIAEPEIQEQEINCVDFIIIASAGLWSVISNMDAVAIVQEIADAEDASRKLIQEAYARKRGRGSLDNITCVVVRFMIS